jgi:hypothetical protein
MTIQPLKEGFKVDPFRGASDSSVSMQWFTRPADERYLSLSDMLAVARHRWDNSVQVRVGSDKLDIIAPDLSEPRDRHRLAVAVQGGGGFIGPISNFAFGQVCQLAQAPSRYLRSLPSPLVSDNLNWGLKHNRSVEHVKLYALDQGDGTHLLRAATGPDYGRIPDWEVIQAIIDVTHDTTWKVPGVMNWSNHVYNPHVAVTKDTTTLFYNDKSGFVFLVDDTRPIEIGKLPDGSPDLIFRGFIVQFCETGWASMQVKFFLLRAVCANRCLWGVEGVQTMQLRHSRLAPDRWLAEMLPRLQDYSAQSEGKVIERVDAAKAAEVAGDEAEALAFLRNRNFSAATAKLILETHVADEGHPARSAWDMVQGITAYARLKANTDDRLEVEAVAQTIFDKAA